MTWIPNMSESSMVANISGQRIPFFRIPRFFFVVAGAGAAVMLTCVSDIFIMM